MDLSIIIVNWNSLRQLRECLISIASVQCPLTIQTIVIDNASYDGSGELIAADFPSVVFIQSIQNMGFAKANNWAARSATGSRILFLNPDTRICQNAMENLVIELDSSPKIGLVAPRVLNDDGSAQLSVQSFPNLINQALDADVLVHLLPDSARQYDFSLSASASSSVVDVVSGACMMMSKKLFEDLGGFTEEFFMYSEDVDLCWKVRQARKQVLYVPSATIFHSGGQSSDRQQESHFSSILQRDSRYRFFRLRRGLIYAGAYWGMTTITSILRLGALSTAVVFTAGRNTRYRFSCRKWFRILSWSLGGQSWASKLNASVTRSNPSRSDISY